MCTYILFVVYPFWFRLVWIRDTQAGPQAAHRPLMGILAKRDLASGRPISRTSSPEGTPSPYGDSGQARHDLRLTYKPHSVQQPDFGLRSEECHPEPRAWAVISLDGASPRRFSGLPGTRTTRAASRPCLALLPAGVAWPPALLRTPVVSYTAFSLLPSPFPPLPRAGEGLGVRATCFCGPVPAGFPAPGVTRRRAPWSADFPRPCTEMQDRDRPASLRLFSSYLFSGS